MLKERVSSEGSPATPDECAGCGGRIQDRYYLLAVDRQWHGSCLRCCECHLPLDSELTCFSRNGNIYCKEDYYRSDCYAFLTGQPAVLIIGEMTGLFCVKCCGRCGNGITANELVMRARDLVYHLGCFSCAACMVQLSKGDVFGMRDGIVYCRPHYDAACLDEFCEDDANTVYSCQDVHSEGDSPPQYYTESRTKGRPRKRKLAQGSPEDTQMQTMGMASTALELLHRGDLSSSMESLAYDSSVASPGSVSGHTARAKRMRTSFKHHQLRTMKSYFAINQNPDAKDLKQLAQKTSLSKRVLQVWFQNARAKWRRNIMRQETNGSSSLSNGSSLTGGTPASLLLTDALHSMEELRHIPHQHTMVFSEMY